MLDRITNHEELFGLLRATCEENNVGVQICEVLRDGDELKDDLIKILKIDDYYSSTRMYPPPPAIDCLIVIKTGALECGLTLVELKNVSRARDLQPRKIRPKFDTTVYDFLSKRFADIFMDSQFELRYFRLWLVTNPYRWPPLSEDEYRKKVKGTVLEMYQTDKPYRFRNKLAAIEHKPPHSTLCTE